MFSKKWFWINNQKFSNSYFIFVLFLFYKSKNKTPLKSSGKLVVNFSKMDIFKMSNFQKLEENVCKKFILLGHRAKYQKNHSKVVTIIFYFFLKNNLETIFLFPNI